MTKAEAIREYNEAVDELDKAHDRVFEAQKKAHDVCKKLSKIDRQWWNWPEWSKTNQRIKIDEM